MSYWRRERKTESEGSQKEPLPEAVNSRFKRIINPGDPVVTFTQAGRATHVNEGTFKGVMRTKYFSRADTDHEWKLDGERTYYVVERPDGKRVKLHFESSLCHAGITVRDLIGHTI